MPTRFSFDGALSNAFRAAHMRSFPWLFAAAFALVVTVASLILTYLARDTFMEVIAGFESFAETANDEPDPYTVFSFFFGMMAPLVPWTIAGGLGYWVIRAVFEAASQRRYIRDERFSLRLGADELRMMVVLLLWWLLYTVSFGLPVLYIFNGIMGIFEIGIDDMSEEEMARKMIPLVFGGMGLMLLVMPVYVFLATRLAPCFAMTIKDRRIVFLDAWNVSRGRFWPILGAFVILSVGGGIASSIISQVLQLVILMPFAGNMNNVQSAEDAIGAIFSPSFLVPMAIYGFATSFMSGLLLHFTGGPAAFAARHDPRGGVDDAAKMAVFD